MRKNYLGIIIHEIFVPQVYSSAVPHEDNNMKKKANLGIIILEILVPQIKSYVSLTHIYM